MKAILLKTLPIFLVICFLAPALANAASSNTGILPDSPFYFIEQIKENIDLMFTFNAETKISKTLSYADKRLAEAWKMIQAGKMNVVKKIIANYEEEINLSKKVLERVNDDQKKSEISKRIEEKVVKDKEPLQLIADGSKSDNDKNDLESKITIDKKTQETVISEPSPTKSLKPTETKKPNETSVVIKKSDQKQKETRPPACNYIYEEGASLYDVCAFYYSDAEKLEAKNLKQDKEYSRFCNGTYYDAKECLSNKGTFNCPSSGTSVCCPKETTYCNGKCWSQCPLDSTFSCSANGNGAVCVSKNQKQIPTPTPQPTPGINNSNNQQTNNTENDGTFLKELEQFVANIEKQQKEALAQYKQKQEECQRRFNEKMAEAEAEAYKQNNPIFAKCEKNPCIRGSDGVEHGMASIELTHLYKLAGIESQSCYGNFSAPNNNQNYNYNSSKNVVYQIYSDGGGGFSIYNNSNPSESYHAYSNGAGGFSVYGQ